MKIKEIEIDNSERNGERKEDMKKDSLCKNNNCNKLCKQKDNRRRVKIKVTNV